jgi:hypothetical protein
MKLTQLATKPQLIQLSIDDAETLEQFGEALEFFTWDRQPLETFMKLASVNHSDAGSMITVVRTLILDEKGKEIIKDDAMLPSNVLIKVISKVVETLGK